MRDYFKNLLINLKLRTGLRQYETLQEESNSQEDFNERLGLLLDELVKTSNRFGKIPDNLKQTAIETALFRDDRVFAITPKWIFQVLSNYYSGNMTKLDAMYRDRNKEPEPEHDEVPPEKVKKYIERMFSSTPEQEQRERENIITVTMKEAHEIYKESEIQGMTVEEWMSRMGYKQDGDKFTKFKGSGSRLREKFTK